MAQNNVEIIISAVDKASKDLKNLDKELKDIDSSGKKAGGTMGDMKTALSAIGLVAGGAAAGIMAAKKAFDFAKEGAALELTEGRFNKLAESIGTTGDALINDLGPAMGGMLSQAEMMAAATDLMGLGLVKNHDEAVRLASVAGQLNMNMNQLVLTLTNKTTMRFDALGVKVDGFTKRVKEMEEAGLDADEAFSEAFLQQAEEQLELVGSAAETSAGQFAMAEARFADMKDEMMRGTMDTLLPLVEGFNEKAIAIDTVTAAFDTGLISESEYNQLMHDLGMNVGNAAGRVGELGSALSEQDARFQEIATSTASFDLALKGLAETTMPVLAEEAPKATAGVSSLILQFKEGAISAQRMNNEILKMMGYLDAIPRETPVSVNIETAGFDELMLASKLFGKDFGINVHTKYTSSGTPPPRGGYQPPPKAAGGPVTGGEAYLVGELGPELFLPGTSGQIVPNNKLTKTQDGNGMSNALLVNINDTLAGLEDGIAVAMRDAMQDALAGV